MAATLPTRIKQNLRDLITSPTSSLSVKTATIQQTLGHPLLLDPEWGMLWKELAPYFPDPATFIPYLSSVLVAWCDSFLVWLEKEGDGEAVERLLGYVRGGRIGWSLEISQGDKISRPTTSWNTAKAAFVLTLPKAAPIQTHTILYGFNTDFQNLFTSSLSLESGDISTSALIPAIEDKDWADLSLDSPKSHSVYTAKKVVDVCQLPGEDTLPDIASILRPEELLKKPPYWMIVRQECKTRVTINGSHAGSLGVLKAYLDRWCRGEPQLVDRPPMVTLRLQDSVFGLGLLNDTLILDGIRKREISAMLVLVFVEDVLGYELQPLSGSAGSVWEFRRTRGFK